MTVIGTDLSWRDRARSLSHQRARVHRWQVRAGGLRRARSTASARSTAGCIAKVASTDKADVDLAVAVARRAFESGVLVAAAAARAQARAAAIRRADARSTREELALLETLDMGKPISDSLAVDIPSAARCIAWYAEAVDKVYDEVAPDRPRRAGARSRASRSAWWRRSCRGISRLIMAAWKIGPALAAGNSFVLKPSEKSPLTRHPHRGARDARPAFPTACSTCCRASAIRPARRSRCTWTSTASDSPARRAPAS